MLAPDASKLADDWWRVQVTNARLQGCTATEVTATSPKRPGASCRHPDQEQHRIRDGRAPRAYSEVAHQASKSCSLRCTNAHAPGAGGVSPRGSRNRTCNGVRTNVGAIADRASADPDAFAILHVWEPAPVPEILQRASADPDAVAVLHPRQHSRRADARRSCVERIAACLCVAISLARAFSEPRRAHARCSCVGMRTFAGEIATFAMHERTCIRSGGVSPPWLAEPHVQRRGAIVRGTSDQRTGERQRSYGTTTPTAG
jgi:hypothetical protein